MRPQSHVKFPHLTRPSDPAVEQPPPVQHRARLDRPPGIPPPVNETAGAAADVGEAKLFPVSPRGSRARRRRRQVLRDLPPGASQQDRDAALEPYLLWLTAAQIATRSSARDNHLSRRRSRRAELLYTKASEPAIIGIKLRGNSKGFEGLTRKRIKVFYCCSLIAGAVSEYRAECRWMDARLQLSCYARYVGCPFPCFPQIPQWGPS